MKIIEAKLLALVGAVIAIVGISMKSISLIPIIPFDWYEPCQFWGEIGFLTVAPVIIGLALIWEVAVRMGDEPRCFRANTWDMIGLLAIQIPVLILGLRAFFDGIWILEETYHSHPSWATALSLILGIVVSSYSINKIIYGIPAIDYHVGVYYDKERRFVLRLR